jgi:transcriptional regulator with XRE-family HTH domain
MSIVNVMRQCQGDMSQNDFAQLLGISQPTLSMIYARQRNPGRHVLAHLVKAFPETRDDVVRFLFASEYHDSDVGITEKIAEPAP